MAKNKKPDTEVRKLLGLVQKSNRNNIQNKARHESRRQAKNRIYAKLYHFQVYLVKVKLNLVKIKLNLVNMQFDLVKLKLNLANVQINEFGQNANEFGQSAN